MAFDSGGFDRVFFSLILKDMNRRHLPGKTKFAYKKSVLLGDVP